MAKIAILGDNHQGVKNDNVVFHDYFSKCFSWFFDYIDANNIKEIIHLGDVYDRRKYINFLSAHRIRKDFFEQIVSRGIKAHIITGNHDVFWKNSHVVNSLEEIIGDRYPGINVYSEPQAITIDGLSIQLVPWICESNAIQSYDTIKNTSCQILVGHFELQGFELLKGVIAEHGDDPALFSKFDLVFSGHYHHKSSKGNIHYLGAFAEYTWADFNDPRGITIFDTDTRKFEFIQNPHTIFKMISYDDDKYPNIMDLIRDKDYSDFKDCYVRIVCVNRKNQLAFDYLLEKLYKVSPADISVIEKEAMTITDTKENQIVDQAQDTSTILDTYIKSLVLPVDNDRLKEFMKEIYEEAMSL